MQNPVYESVSRLFSSLHNAKCAFLHTIKRVALKAEPPFLICLFNAKIRFSRSFIQCFHFLHRRIFTRLFSVFHPKAGRHKTKHIVMRLFLFRKENTPNLFLIFTALLFIQNPLAESIPPCALFHRCCEMHPFCVQPKGWPQKWGHPFHLFIQLSLPKCRVCTSSINCGICPAGSGGE